jgi:MFS family permease
VAQRWSPQLWAILIVLCGALFLDALDVSMVGVALPDIRTALGLSTSSLQWVVSGYVLGYGGLLLLGGRAADLLGRRRVFLFALGLFAVASLFGGLVSSPGLLIGARFVKGIAAAFTARPGCPCSPPRSTKARCGTGRSACTQRSGRAASRLASSCPACSPR